jgi:hypothetical protein
VKQTVADGDELKLANLAGSLIGEFAEELDGELEKENENDDGVSRESGLLGRREQGNRAHSHKTMALHAEATLTETSTTLWRFIDSVNFREP